MKIYKRGFIALILVLTVSTIALLVSAGILLQSVTEEVASSNEEMSSRAWSAVNGCVETALFKLASSTGWTYTGNESITIDPDSCYILPITATGTVSKLIRASSTVSGFTRKMEVVVATTSTSTPLGLTVTSWQEVGDFSE
ncbi:MAG: hypothetical protein WCW14_02360 [Candidatus Paceibacterota bacterium]|jgi:type II secretory pathway component PulK